VIAAPIANRTCTDDLRRKFFLRGLGGVIVGAGSYAAREVFVPLPKDFCEHNAITPFGARE